MARLGRRGFLAVAVIFHVIYAVSIFDIYFVSPIVRGMKAFGVERPEAPAKRLVLFVGDGLRADKAFQSFPDPSPPPGVSKDEAERPRPLAPFLRSRVLEHGTFGVSHTRVPTESRPGHVALIAGLYEDVSAVTTGWKLNPVNFDSVFNRSRHTWSWGSPDILPMFEQGAVPGRIDAYCYGAEDEDFTADATALDDWVFDRVKGLFEDAKRNATLHAALHDDKLVFFLHLLGLDTTGHAYRPYSKEYLHNIKVVDRGVQEITELIDRFYGDGKTAYVFTADHGMSDWGSHGDGHPDNTRTPLIAWGSGIARPVIAKNGLAPGHDDGFSADWNLDQVSRHDVAQADVAALMAYLAGLQFPVNSVGELPLAYLDATPKEKAQALLMNAHAILEMYYVKEQQKKDTVIRYQPYPAFAGADNVPKKRLNAINDLINQAGGNYERPIEECDAFIKLTLQGIRYLQTYDWLFLRTIITLGYAGFVAFAFTTIIDLYVLHGATDGRRTITSSSMFLSVMIALYTFLYSRGSPLTYYAYTFFPVFFWEEVWNQRAAWVVVRETFLGDMSAPNAYLNLAGSVLAFLGVLEALAQSYFHRQAFTVCYICAVAWPAFYGKDFVLRHRTLSVTWALCCATLSAFTLLPANKVEDTTQILLGGSLMFAIGALYLLFEKSVFVHTPTASGQLAKPAVDTLSRTILGIQTGLIGLAMLTTRSSITSLQARLGLPLGTQLVGWLVLIASLAVPFLHSLQPSTDSIRQLVIVFLTFAPIFIILTISYEGLFYLAFCALLFTWTKLERHVYKHTLAQRVEKASQDIKDVHSNGHAATNGVAKKAGNGPPDRIKRVAKDTPAALRALTLTDIRISLFYLFLLQSAFFSTGNIASISSFSLDAVYRLIPVFDPFSQGALLLLKILIPYYVLSVNLGVLSKSIGFGAASSAKDGNSGDSKASSLQSGLGAPLGMLAVVMGDWLTVRFFWCVKDEGSWLEIGESITKFIIASMLGAFVSGLEVVGEYVTRDSDVIGGADREEADHVKKPVKDR